MQEFEQSILNNISKKDKQDMILEFYQKPHDSSLEYFKDE